MTKVAVLLEEGFEDLEFFYPKMRLEEEGLKVLSVSRKDNVYKSKHGYPAKPDMKVSEIDFLDFSGVVVPGGRKCPDLLRTDERVLEFVKTVYNNGGIVGAICHGPWVLASSRILEGKTVTCYHAIKDDVKNAGAEYRDKEVVHSDGIVTSRKPSDLPFFMEKLLDVL